MATEKQHNTTKTLQHILNNLDKLGATEEDVKTTLSMIQDPILIAMLKERIPSSTPGIDM